MAEDDDEYEGFPEPPVGDKAKSLADLFDYTKIIDITIHSLRREYPITSSKNMVKWKKRSKEPPLLNDQGIDDIVVLIRSICHPGTALSSVEKDERGKMNDLLRIIGSDLITMLTKYYEAYEIRKTSHINVIYYLVTDLLEFAIKHPYNQGARMFLARAISETNVIRHTTDEEGVII